MWMWNLSDNIGLKSFNPKKSIHYNGFVATTTGPVSPRHSRWAPSSPCIWWEWNCPRLPTFQHKRCPSTWQPRTYSPTFRVAARYLPQTSPPSTASWATSPPPRLLTWPLPRPPHLQRPRPAFTLFAAPPGAQLSSAALISYIHRRRNWAPPLKVLPL